MIEASVFIKKYHASWLIAWASLGILIGTFASVYSRSFVGLEWLVLAICLCLIGIINRRIFGVILILSSGLLFGLWRGSIQLQSQAGYENYYNQEVISVGIVSEDPSIDSDGGTSFKLRDVIVNGQNLGGKLWAATNERIDIRRSDTVTIEGRLTTGFGNIPAAMYRSRVVIVERPDYADVGRDTRDWFADGVRNAIPEPEASLGTGFLLGQKTTLPENLDNNLRLLGLTHIVVASGYNLTILVRFSRRFFTKLSRFTALAGSFGMIFLFLQLTGNSPSMTRASLITSLSLIAWYFGRKIHPMVLLPFSAAITVVINPSYVWGDIGWILSYTSFIGIILFAPLVNAYFWGDKKPNSIRQVFIETMSAQLLTLPVIAFVFAQYSPLALPANLVILPLIPIAMSLTAVAGLGGVLLPVGAVIVGAPAYFVLRYMTTVINYLAQLPLATAELKFNQTTVIVFYLSLIVAMIYMWRRTRFQFRNFNVIE